VIPVGGVTNIAKWVRYYSVHGIPILRVFDTDSAKTGADAAKALVARHDILTSLKLDPPPDWRGYVTGPIGVHERFAVLDSNYETAMRTVFGAEYETRESEGRDIVGDAKPLVARFAARSLPPPPEVGSSAWDALRPLAETVLALPVA
jgi:hypothetical protein